MIALQIVGWVVFVGGVLLVAGLYLMAASDVALRRLGPAYLDYKQRVPFLIPRRTA